MMSCFAARGFAAKAFPLPEQSYSQAMQIADEFGEQFDIALHGAPLQQRCVLEYVAERGSVDLDGAGDAVGQRTGAEVRRLRQPVTPGILTRRR